MSSLLAINITHRSLLSFAIPTILSFIFVNIYFIIDGIFVSNAVGTAGLAAVNICMPTIGIVFALSAVISTGGNALIAAMLGEKRTVEARQNFTLLVLFSMIVTSIIAVFCLIFMTPLLYLLGANDTILPLCKAYTLPLFISIPFVSGGMILDSFLVVEGRPKLSMLSAFVGGLINVVLDYIFLFILNMGIEGAAIATGIGYSVSALIGLTYFGIWRKGTLKFIKPVMRWNVINKSLSNGISEMVTMLATSLFIVVLNNTMMRFAGEDGVAAISIIQYVEELLNAVYSGYSEGVAPLMSYNFGERNINKMRRIYKYSLHIISCFAIATFLLSFIIAEPVVSAFAENNINVYEMAVHGFRIFAFGFLFVGFNVYASSLFTALNNGRISAILSFCHTMIFSIGTLLILPQIFALEGVWLANPVAELMSFIMTFFVLKLMSKKYGY